MTSGTLRPVQTSEPSTTTRRTYRRGAQRSPLAAAFAAQGLSGNSAAGAVARAIGCGLARAQDLLGGDALSDVQIAALSAVLSPEALADVATRQGGGIAAGRPPSPEGERRRLQDALGVARRRRDHTLIRALESALSEGATSEP